MRRFTGKTAIVTGASRGIGRAVALRLAREGARLALLARGEDDLRSVADEAAALGAEPVVVTGDACDPSVADRLLAATLAKHAKVDILVNNVGGGSDVLELDEVSDDDWSWTMETNLGSAFRLCRAVIPLMRRLPGRIVNISSVAGRFRGHLSGAPYAAAKAGLNGLTRHLASDLGPFGITVNAVAPGLTLTERARAKWEQRSEADRERILASVPLRRFAAPEEVAAAVAFLASDDASYITGVTLDVNGGVWMG